VFTIGNHHLTVGARIAGDLARAHGGAGPGQPLRLRFRGSAGQSFGAFTLPRMHLQLEGEANDHVGKGLCGGEIVIRPFRGAAYANGSHVLLGNTALYGATSGRLFAAGAAGDRFAVRNSGAVAVIEGAGDHCCEYMTGGLVIVLGPVGRNFAAGMSNGIAYVLDERGALESHCNLEMVAVTSLNSMDERALRKLIQQHFHKTASGRARLILAQWEAYRAVFRKVAPPAVAVTERWFTSNRPGVLHEAHHDDRPSDRVPEVKAALFRAGITGITLSRVSGHGGEHERFEQYRGTALVMEFHEKVKIEMVCSEPFVGPACRRFSRRPARRGGRREDFHPADRAGDPHPHG
jgi:glutamate synthase domain-containing protein 3